MPRVGAIAIAITSDEIRMTNHPWSFSVRVLRDRLSFESLVVTNDFTAVAMAVPLLAETHRLPIGGGGPVARRTIAVLVRHRAWRLGAGSGRVRVDRAVR